MMGYQLSGFIHQDDQAAIEKRLNGFAAQGNCERDMKTLNMCNFFNLTILQLILLKAIHQILLKNPTSIHLSVASLGAN